MALAQKISARRLAALWAAAMVLLCGAVLGAPAASDDDYTDENRPYEFGFVIEGQQHRHEKKDERGIIMGEFGFITADGVYHVTVYATDENGDFKIISMKNIRLGPPLDQMRTAPGSSTTARPVTSAPAPARTSVAQPLSSTSRAAIRLDGANGCSGCLIPTTTAAAPPAIGNELQPPFPGGPAAVGAPGRPGAFGGGASSGDRTTGGFSGGAGDRTGGGGGSFGGGAPGSAVGSPGSAVGGGSAGRFGAGAPGSVGGTGVGPLAGGSGGSVGGGAGGFGTIGGGGSGTVGGSVGGIGAGPLGGGRGSSVDRGAGGFGSVGGGGGGNVGGGAGGSGFGGGANVFGAQGVGRPGQPPAGSQPVGQRPVFGSTPGVLAPSGGQPGPTPPRPPGLAPASPFGGAVSPPSTQQQGGARPAPFGQQPAPGFGGAGGGVQTPTGGVRPPPGEVAREGLPPGVTMQDVMDALLYRFNYTLPYHGHHEEGYRSGSKLGGYFADDRDGSGRSVKYLANEFGYQPNITLVDLRPQQAHTAEDERRAPLLGYKFEWLY